MRKHRKKITAILLTLLLLVAMIPGSAFAAEEHSHQVHVIVENTTYHTDAGAPWEGRRIDAWVPLEEDSTGISLLEDAVGPENLDAPDGGWGPYVKTILGITAGDGGAVGSSGYNMAGWMFAFNDCMTNLGIGSYSAAAGTLSPGDEISFRYSLDGGPDIGYQWDDSSAKALKSLTVSAGILSPAFSSGVTSYTLTIPEDVHHIVVTPKAENLAQAITISKDGVEYKRTMNIPVEDASQITIACSDGGGSMENPTVYSIHVKQGNPVQTDAMYADIIHIMNDNLTDAMCVYGNEWVIMALARAGALSDAKAAQYYASVEGAVRELGSPILDETYPTTNARVVLALTAIGKDPTDVAGYNLLLPLADMDYITKQGINGAMYALLAFDAYQYLIPKAPENTVQATRDHLIQTILAGELAGGGWNWSYDMDIDPDLTANALLALAPYYHSHAGAAAAVDRGIQALSDIQNPDAGYSSWGVANACSTAQILTALTSLGIDPATDSRFVKNGRTILNALGDFYVSGSGFHYDFTNTVIDFPFSTVQAASALISYERMTKGLNPLYDMRDVQRSGQGNQNPDHVPATGDFTPMIFWFLLMLISAAGVAATKSKRFL